MLYFPLWYFLLFSFLSLPPWSGSTLKSWFEKRWASGGQRPNAISAFLISLPSRSNISRYWPSPRLPDSFYKIELVCTTWNRPDSRTDAMSAVFCVCWLPLIVLILRAHHNFFFLALTDLCQRQRDSKPLPGRGLMDPSWVRPGPTGSMMLKWI